MKFYLTLDVTELDPGDRADLDLALAAAANVVNLTVRDPTQWAEALVGLVELAANLRAPGARALAAAVLKDDRLQRAEFPATLAARLREVAEPRPCSGLPAVLGARK